MFEILAVFVKGGSGMNLLARESPGTASLISGFQWISGSIDFLQGPYTGFTHHPGALLQQINALTIVLNFQGSQVFSILCFQSKFSSHQTPAVSSGIKVNINCISSHAIDQKMESFRKIIE